MRGMRFLAVAIVIVIARIASVQYMFQHWVQNNLPVVDETNAQIGASPSPKKSLEELTGSLTMTGLSHDRAIFRDTRTNSEISIGLNESFALIDGGYQIILGEVNIPGLYAVVIAKKEGLEIGRRFFELFP